VDYIASGLAEIVPLEIRASLSPARAPRPWL